MKQRTLQHLYAYWNEVRAGRLAPQRLEIEPSRIAGILSETFMLERSDPRTYQYRLAGTRLCELFGTELRGANFLSSWSEADRDLLQRQLAAVCEQGCALVLTVEGIADARHRLELEAILLPLMHGGSRITRVIGAMSPASAPHWVYDMPLVSRRLVRHETLWPDGRPHAVIQRASNPVPFHPRLLGGRIVRSERRRFRVLDGGRSGKYDKT